jgi:hypothetical protein
MKKPRAGGEIDAYCTKCRLDLNHRIVAMVGDQVKQVECLTCRGTHTYRRPRSEIAAAADKRIAAKAERSTLSSSRPPKSAASRESHAARAEREQKSAWERSIAGQPASAFKVYRVFETFNPGDLVRHSKFGDGVIARVIDRGKVEVLFQEGPKTLAHNQQAT